MAELYANNYGTVLASPCDDNDLSIVVLAAAPAALQGGQFRVAIDAELLLVTAGQSGTTWTVTRGIEGTTAAAHAGGATVSHVLTSGSLGTIAAPTLYAAYADQPDGTPATADSGQTWTYYASNADNAMRVVSGKLTNVTASGVAAGYVQRDLGAPVTRIGADFTLGTQTTDNGAFGLVIFKTPIASATIPDSNFHLVVTRLNWQLGKFVSNVFTLLAQGGFASALACDGATVHHVDCVLNGTTASLLLPDGSAVNVTDAAIGATPGQIACFETYAFEASTDAKAAAVAVWANATSVAPPARVPDLSAERLIPILPNVPFVKPVTARWAPASTDVAIPAYPPAEIDTAFRCDVVAPPSGGFICDLYGYVKMGVSGEVFWNVLYIGGASVGSARPVNGWDDIGPYMLRHARIIIPAGSYAPGSTHTLTFGHWTTVTNAGTVFHVDVASAYEASMTVSPL